MLFAPSAKGRKREKRAEKAHFGRFPGRGLGISYFFDLGDSGVLGSEAGPQIHGNSCRNPSGSNGSPSSPPPQHFKHT